jgi:hypothetical protein
MIDSNLISSLCNVRDIHLNRLDVFSLLESSIAMLREILWVNRFEAFVSPLVLSFLSGVSGSYACRSHIQLRSPGLIRTLGIFPESRCAVYNLRRLAPHPLNRHPKCF